MHEITALEALADRIVALVRARDGNEPHSIIEANVTVTRDNHGLTRFANSFIHQHVGEDTITASLTLAVDGQTTSASTTAVDDASLGRLVDNAVTSAKLQPLDPHWPGATPLLDVVGTGNVDPVTAATTPLDRAQRVKAFVDAAPDLRAAGYVDTQLVQVAFASTAGHRTSGASTRATIDGIHQTEHSAGSGHGTSHALDALDASAVGTLAAGRARRSAQFTDLEPGEYEVVLSPEAVATVLTFLAVYGFNAKAHLDGGSFARLGELQFDPSISLLEDPSDPRAITLPFDAEGTPRQRFSLVDQGVTTAFAHDRRTAARMHTASTGNALPGGEGFGPVPTSIVMPAGPTPVNELTSAVERGLLVTNFHYVRILDPKTQVSTGLTRNGTFLIEDGEIIGAVGNLRFTQSFIEGLASGAVLGIGNDDRFADAEFGPGMVICPSLRLARWTFTGGAQG